MTTKGEWVAYTGSDEQIAEIMIHPEGLLTDDGVMVECDKYLIIHDILTVGDKYLLCNPHPLADMICQWARTGQTVWVRHKKDNLNKGSPTTKPYWDVPYAEYSFTPFKGTPK